MFNTLRSKHVAIGLVFSIFLFFSPHLFSGSANAQGKLIGNIFQNDGTTPVEGAVLKIRNVSTGSYYESSSSDENGHFAVVRVDEGLYIAGITTESKDFNIENLIGIKANETAEISIALDPVQEEKEKKRGLIGFFLSPAGIAVIVASTVAIVYGVVKLTEKEEEASPFKK
jgi:hypothetical protein